MSKVEETCELCRNCFFVRKLGWFLCVHTWLQWKQKLLQYDAGLPECNAMLKRPSSVDSLIAVSSNMWHITGNVPVIRPEFLLKKAKFKEEFMRQTTIICVQPNSIAYYFHDIRPPCMLKSDTVTFTNKQQKVCSKMFYKCNNNIFWSHNKV